MNSQASAERPKEVSFTEVFFENATNTQEDEENEDSGNEYHQAKYYYEKIRPKKLKKNMYHQTTGQFGPPEHVHYHDWKAMLSIMAKKFPDQSNYATSSSSNGHALTSNEHFFQQVQGEQILLLDYDLHGLSCGKAGRALSSAILTTKDGLSIIKITNPNHSEHSTIRSQPEHSRMPDSKINPNIWIEQTFSKRECCAFIRSSKDPEKCGCGKWRQAHEIHGLSPVSRPIERYHRQGSAERWTINKHTTTLPTDAYGTIEFLGSQHPYKAQYIRLAFDTDPADILCLFERVWELAPPKLIISVHGGHKNFDLQPKLARIFRNGIIKAAKSTNAWIITSGIDEGVVKHVSAALEPVITTSKARAKIVSIGIAPWGLVKRRESLIGKNTNVFYHPQSISGRGRYAVLNSRHSYYLFVDNGTVGRYGAEIILRRRLESFIMEKRTINDGCGRSVPVVCVVLEGGPSAVRTVLDYVTLPPKVPVVICDGSGRAADLMAFAHQYVDEDGELPDEVYPQMMEIVKSIFGFDDDSANTLIKDILASVVHKNLVTIYRMGLGGPQQDVDHSILTALLKGHELSSHEQLMLALAWNRVDIAKTDIFTLGKEWSKEILHNAMMEALIQNRVDFVRLLLEKGVNMQKFLTISRLEDLYNTDQGPPNTLHYIIKDVVSVKKGYRYILPHIGLVVEKLMGHGYRSRYASDEFKDRYYSYKRAIKDFCATAKHLSKAYSTESYTVNPAVDDQIPINKPVRPPKRNSTKLSLPRLFAKDTKIDMDTESVNTTTNEGSINDFPYPFSDLFIWAVLTKRQDMAICMWEHGEEAMAKALVGNRLYKALAYEAIEDYIESEICTELREYSEQFHTRSLELLDHCHKHDDDNTLQLLTYELTYWGYETCLSLAVICHSKVFLAHPCCQILLADLWHGGLRIRRHTNVKVIAGLLFPPYIFYLEFKSKEELMLQPQTVSEHEHDLRDTSSSSDEDSDNSDTSLDEWDSSEGESKSQQHAHQRNRIESRISRKNSVDMDSEHSHYGTFFQTFKNQLSMRSDLPIQIKSRASSAISSDKQSTVIPKKKKYTKKKVAGIATIQKNISDTELARKKSLAIPPPYQGLHFAKKVLFSYKTIREQRKRALSQSEKQINWRRKLYEFYVAPITTFWTWALSYAVFLCVFIYVLLVKTPENPSPPEWYLFAYVGSCGLELFRRLYISSPTRTKEKLTNFFVNFWNSLTTLAVLGFLIGFGFRLIPTTIVREARPWATQSYYDLDIKKDIGRIILAVDSILWVMKMLEYLSIHPRFGPYINVAGKMIRSAIFIIILMTIALLAFGLPKQSISFPAEEWHWLLVRNIFYKPYFMVYGEVYAAEIDLCDDDAWDGHLDDKIPLSDYNTTQNLHCVPGYWIPPLLMVLFMIMTTFLLLSMLIATFNSIFEETSRIANQIWLFQRYNQVIQYECTPFIPPPFTPIYYVYMLFKYINYHQECWLHPNSDAAKKKHEYKKLHRHTLFELSLKLYLSQEQVEKLHDFEEECMDELSRAKEAAKLRSTEERIKRTAERTEAVNTKLDGLTGRENSVIGRLNELEISMKTSDERQAEIINFLQEISDGLAALRTEKSSKTKPVEIYEPLTKASTSNFLSPDQGLSIEKRGRATSVIGSGDEFLSPLSDRKFSPYRKESLFSLAPRSTSIFKRPSGRKRSDYTSITDNIVVVQDVEFGPQLANLREDSSTSRTISSGDLSLGPSIKREDSTEVLESEDNMNYSEIEEETESVVAELETITDDEKSSVDNKQ